MNRSVISLAMSCLLFCACSPMMGYTRTGPTQPPRSVDCAFEVYTSQPSGSFVEIGTVDVVPSGATVPDTQLAAFKKKLTPYVCHLGGDAAVAYANGMGYYMKASVLKHVASAPKPAALPSGCQFDTQCKGDRVCVKGECVSP